MSKFSAFLLDSDSHSGRNSVPDIEHSLALNVIPRVAIEYVRADGSRCDETDCVGCLCGKCRAPMDLSALCRFYELRGGRYDGLRIAGHAKCVKDADAIKVSSESAVDIFVRQRREQGGRVTPKKR